MTATRGLVAVRDSGIDLRPDAGRVITRLFVPGNEDVGPGDSRAGPVIERVLALSDADVVAAMADLRDTFGEHHDDLDAVFEEHAALVSGRLDPEVRMSPDRRRLLGAAFTHEYAIEGAALCNPSIVRHPRQTSADTAIVVSVRGIGEGHRSSIGFRTGSVDAAGTVTIDPPGPQPRTAAAGPAPHHRAVLHRKLAEVGDDHENASFVLDALPDRFDDADLTRRIEALDADALTRRNTATTIEHLLDLSRRSYRVEFPAGGDLSERVLWPQTDVERHGMEDARFVEITDGSAPRYCATYTAFDGRDINQHLLVTDDFRSFEVGPMAGAAATGKGLALFPRQVHGRYLALSRADRETNSIAASDHLLVWDDARTLQTPQHAWELLQLGNCGSPIETSEGWLVITHGVGPMRRYSLGAMLLDLDEPHRVIATGTQPLLEPRADQRRGYVPNVVYSCGALALGDLLVLPYGVGDQSIAVATLSIGDVLSAMGPPPAS